MARQAAEGGRPGGISAEELVNRGGEGDGYSWTQDEDEVEVTITGQPGMKASSVKVAFKATTLKVALTGGAELDLTLFDKVTPDGCSWSLSDGSVVISLEKATEGATWPALTK